MLSKIQIGTHFSHELYFIFLLLVEEGDITTVCDIEKQKEKVHRMDTNIAVPSSPSSPSPPSSPSHISFSDATLTIDKDLFFSLCDRILHSRSILPTYLSLLRTSLLTYRDTDHVDITPLQFVLLQSMVDRTSIKKRTPGLVLQYDMYYTVPHLCRTVYPRGLRQCGSPYSIR